MDEDIPADGPSQMEDYGGSNSDSSWDEVVLATDSSKPLNDQGGEAEPEEPKTIEITLQSATVSQSSKAKMSPSQLQRNAQIRAETLLRIESHKLHAICLLKSFSIRNRWVNDELLHARLLSLTPLPLQNGFSTIHKKRIPDQARRGRLFESALFKLTEWWYRSFELEEHGHIKSRTFKQTQEEWEEGSPEYQGEALRSAKSLMKHALMGRGSRDTSSILFAALCRSLSIPTRLVVSLQAVPWQAGVGKQKEGQEGRSLSKGKERADPNSSDDSMQDEQDDMEEIQIPNFAEVEPDASSGVTSDSTPGEGASTSKKKMKPHMTGRKMARRRLAQAIAVSKTRPPVGGWPPTIWVEVFSRPDSRWMPVDPVRYMVNKRKLMEPPSHDQCNRMTYVVAFEEDGYAKDVTKRYAREYWAKTIKSRAGSRNGREEWWSTVINPLTRPFRLQRDDLEDEEFRTTQFAEGMPNSVAGFKDHPLFILERHLKQIEVIYPKDAVGKFRGESVYPRSNVIALKTPENWMRTGRRVKEGAQAMKMVKQRAVTINRKRALEMAHINGDDSSLQGLYALEQTELYVPDPVVDGKVPKNDFGNIDLYTPSMLPEGGAHIPYNGVAKVARALGIDYAEAVTGFEFRKGKALPILTGVVIATENEETLVEAYWEMAQIEEVKRRNRTRERVLKHWTKLIQGLRIQQRMHEQYGQPAAGTSKSALPPAEVQAEEGGFITEADRIVQPFHLPKPVISVLDLDPAVDKTPTDNYMQETDAALASGTDVRPMDVYVPENEDHETEETTDTAVLQQSTPVPNGVPLTMQSLAESSARLSMTGTNPKQNSSPSSLAGRAMTRKQRSTARKSKANSQTDSSEEEPDSSAFGEGHTARGKRKRHTAVASHTPPAARRGLRPRVPKSTERVLAEIAAENALRQALEEE